MRTYITGMGLVCGLGKSVTDVFHRLCAGEHVFRAIDRFPTEPYAQSRGGELPPGLEDELRASFPDDDLALAMIVKAGREALEQAGEEDAPPPAAARRRAHRALVLATNFGAMEALEWAWRERQDTGRLDEASFQLFDGLAAVAASTLGCDGPVAQVSMSCASGAAAVAAARDMLAAGQADQVLVVAYDDLSEFCWCGLSNLRTITTDIMRPFDVKRSGTIFSEGAAAVLLESSPADTGRVLATVAGAATGNNAFHLTAPPQDADGSRQVMAAALAQAGLEPSAVEHVCAHATSTSANDSTEAAALRNLLGGHLAGTSVAAHKSQLGHLMGAAGLAEAVVTVMAMRTSVIPPTINLLEQDPKCQPLDCVRGVARARQVATAVTNSAGIGGNNAALALLAGHQPGTASPARPAPSPHPARRVLVFQAGWVLPANIGSGDELFRHPEWLEAGPDANARLADFSPKPYLQSVKGYLDPGGAMLLAAARLAISTEVGAAIDGARNQRHGISTVTRFGSMGSGYAFFTQMASKGPRAASPMIFPHGYANTPGNLAAIEFGCAGPHMVFYGPQDARAALDFAVARLLDGSADDMLVGFYESAPAPALPDGWAVLHGAVVLRLGVLSESEPACGWELPLPELAARPATAMPAAGAVAALKDLLAVIRPQV